MKYHKIQTVYKRDPENNNKTLLEGQFSMPEFEYLANCDWVYTEKVDGTNIRVYWDCEKLLFCGKTDNAQIPIFLLSKLIELFPFDKFAELYPETSMTLFGEGYGAKIQKGGGNYISDGVSFILFDVNIDGIWLERDNVLDIGSKLEIEIVPIVDNGNLYKGIELVKQKVRSFIGKDISIEGLVMRPAIELLTRRGERIITKIKHKDFINKEK